MPPATSPRSSYGETVSVRRRTLSLLAAIAINILLLLLLLNLSPTIEGRPDGHNQGITFSLADSRNNAAERTRTVKTTRSRAKARATPTSNARAMPPPLVPVRSGALANIINLSHDEFAIADIAKMPAPAQGEAGGNAGAAGDSAPAGSGPHGEPLYAAEWYREPRQSELDFYLPKTGIPAGSWAEIACQTIARFHVDNCVALADSPPGSRLARAIEAAGWQFLVRPPRVGGRSMVGAWVRIRIDFTNKPDVR